MKKYIFIALIIVFIGIGMRYGISPWTSFVPERTAYSLKKDKAIDIISIKNNFRQTPYDCGAYNIRALLSAIDKKADIDDIIRENNYKLIPKVGVVPEVIQSTLNKYGVSSRIRTFRWMSPDEKIKTLKYTLGLSKPIIALIKSHGFLHYVLLTGFENDQIYFYDPLLKEKLDGITIDNTADFSGNDSLTFKEFINLWDEASYYGLYKDMAIIIDL